MEWPERLTENINYLLVESTSDNIDKIWIVDTEADMFQFICTHCYKFTADNTASVASHLKRHAHEREYERLVPYAFELLPLAIRTRLIAQAKQKEVGK